MIATSGIEPDLTAHEAIVTTFTPYRFGTLFLNLYEQRDSNS